MIVAGFGFRGSSTEDSLRDALSRTGATVRPTHFATAAAKAEHAAFQALAASSEAEVVSVDAADLVAQQTATQSNAAFEAHGTGSVAEAAALAAAGPGAKLLAQRAISADRKATCAIATGGET